MFRDVMRQATTPRFYQLVIGNKNHNFDHLLPLEDNKERLQNEIARIWKRDDIRIREIRWQSHWT